MVISALEGSPAGEAEITSGTQLLSVDGRAVVDLGLEGTVGALRGDVGSQVVLTLDNGSGETNELTLERRSVDLRPVRTCLLYTSPSPRD